MRCPEFQFRQHLQNFVYRICCPSGLVTLCLTGDLSPWLSQARQGGGVLAWPEHDHLVSPLLALQVIIFWNILHLLKYFTFIEIFYIYWNILHLLKYFPCSQQPCPPPLSLTPRCSSTSSPGIGPHQTEVQQGQKPIRRGRKPLSLDWFCL